jgi:hypothetical protein
VGHVSVLQLARAVLRGLISPILALAVLWAAAALWIDGPSPRALSGALAGGLILVAVTAAVLVRPWRRAALAVFLTFAVVLGWWLTLSPSNGRDWQPDVAPLPTATLDQSRLTVRNVRNFAYRSETDFTERWETRTYDLDTLWHHTRAVGSGPSLDWRLLANGYLVDLAYERGTVNTGIPLAELKRQSDITARARSAGDREDFSKVIREGLPPRPPPRGSPVASPGVVR